jgi:hypothetical protein
MKQLDSDVCYRALQARDPRFDGRLFVAVTSTGIYCRPGARIADSFRPPLPLRRPAFVHAFVVVPKSRPNWHVGKALRRPSPEHWR